MPTARKAVAKVNWLVIERKIKGVAIAAIALDGVTIAAAWRGTITWHDAIGACVAIDVPAIVGYWTKNA